MSINPNQEPPAEELTFGEAVWAIAERTAFRTEAERDAVYAAIDKQITREGAEPHDSPDESEPEPDQGGDQGDGATPTSPTTDDKPPATRRGK